MAEYRLISADSHVSEPPNLWSERVDKKYRERAPHLMINPPGKEGAYFYYEGYAPHPIGIGLGGALIVGWGNAARRLKISDPWYGDSIVDYSTFVSGYQGSGTWTHSYRTQP